MSRPRRISRTYCRLQTKLDSGRTLTCARWLLRPRLASLYEFPDCPGVVWTLIAVYAEDWALRRSARHRLSPGGQVAQLLRGEACGA